MQIRSPRDFFAGLVFMAIAGTFIWLALGYRYGTAQRMGPGFFPIWVGGLLGVLGFIVMARSFVIKGPSIDRIGFRELGVTLVAVAVFGLVLTHFGLVAAILALVLFGALADRTAKPLETIALAVFLATFSVGIFVYLLGLPLQVWPQGFLKFVGL